MILWSVCSAQEMQVVLKPAEATPLTALALAELAQRSGIPPGVMNIVVGGASAIGRSPPESRALNDLDGSPNFRCRSLLHMQRSVTSLLDV